MLWYQHGLSGLVFQKCNGDNGMQQNKQRDGLPGTKRRYGEASSIGFPFAASWVLV